MTLYVIMLHLLSDVAIYFSHMIENIHRPAQGHPNETD